MRHYLFGVILFVGAVSTALLQGFGGFSDPSLAYGPRVFSSLQGETSRWVTRDRLRQVIQESSRTSSGRAFRQTVGGTGAVPFRDVSLDPLPKGAYVPKGKVWLINYADGSDVHRLNAHFQVQTALNRGIDAVIMYGPRDLDEDFRRENEAILSQKRGAGYWLWKPYIILKTLQQVPENDIVFYYDAGLCLVEHIGCFLQPLESKEAVFCVTHLNRPYMKRDCWQLMGMDESVLDEKQVPGGALFFRNTPRTRAFTKKWLDHLKDPRLVTDQPSKEPEDPLFKEHRHDQAVLTLCLIQEEQKPLDQEDRLSFLRWDNYPLRPWAKDDKSPLFWHHRRSVDRGSLFDICPDA